MQKKIQLLPSGIPLVDKEWKGLYRGGTYLLIGPCNSGKTLLSLQYAMETARQNELCLFFTNSKPKDLIIRAASVNIDLQSLLQKNKVIIIKVAPPSESKIVDSDCDEFLAEYLKDIITVVEQFQPSKIVFDELTPFIELKEIEFLQKVFSYNCDKIEEVGITTLYTVSEPAMPASQEIVGSISEKCTGMIYLKKEMQNEQSGEMIITSNIENTEG